MWAILAPADRGRGSGSEDWRRWAGLLRCIGAIPDGARGLPAIAHDGRATDDRVGCDGAHVHSARGSARTLVPVDLLAVQVCWQSSPTPFPIISSLPFLHEAGLNERSRISHKSGAWICVHNMPFLLRSSQIECLSPENSAMLSTAMRHLQERPVMFR